MGMREDIDSCGGVVGALVKRRGRGQSAVATTRISQTSSGPIFAFLAKISPNAPVSILIIRLRSWSSCASLSACWLWDKFQHADFFPRMNSPYYSVVIDPGSKAMVATYSRTCVVSESVDCSSCALISNDEDWFLLRVSVVLFPKSDCIRWTTTGVFV
jgi:hypothetical protein